MVTNFKRRWIAVVGAALLGSIPASAIPITISSPERTATLDSAIPGSGRSGPGNANTNTLEGLDAPFYNGDWTSAGVANGASGTFGFLTVELTSGTWGGQDIEGNWSIDASFWNTYADAAISIHVGNGNGDPDHFIWRIEQGETSGTWSYEDFDGRGGGLSNMHLSGRGVGAQVPDGGGSLTLLGLSLMGFAGLRKLYAR